MPFGGYLFLCMVAVTLEATGVGPQPEPHPARPGIKLDFDGGPAEFGVVITQTGMTRSGGVLVNDSDGGFARYQTTWNGTTSIAPLHDDEDWAFQVQWKTDAATSGATVFELGAPGGDIAKLFTAGTAGNYVLLGGNGSGSYVQIGAEIAFAPDVFYTLTVHYKASSGLLDFYIGDTLTRAGFHGRSGVYDIDFVQLRGGFATATLDRFDNLLIGPPAGSPGAEPGPVFGPFQSGIVVDFNTDGDVAPPEFGKRIGGGSFTVSNGVAVSDGDNAFLRYEPTRAGSATIEALPDGADWVCSLYWETDAAVPGSTVFELTGPGGDIARFSGTGSAGDYALFGGNGSGSYAQIGAPFTIPANARQWLTVHYRAGAQLLDFWLNGTLERTGFASRSATYAVDFVQIRGGAIVGTTDTFDDVRLGATVVAINTYSFADVTTAVIPALASDAAAWGDYNNDEWIDLYAEGLLYWNDGGTYLAQVNATTMGKGIWGDYDNDGFLDIFSWQLGGKLYRNLNGSGSFSDEPFPAMVTSSARIEGASWADHNGDGFIDLYVGGYEDGGLNGEEDARYTNQAGVSFVNAWTEGGSLKNGRGVTSCDFDEDGDIDIFVSNYRLQENFLWQNDGTGGFANVAPAFNADGAAPGNPDWPYAHTIGSAWGDLDNDGHFDLFVGNFAHPYCRFSSCGGCCARQPESEFLRNLGPAGSFHFDDMASTAGLAYQESYAHPTLGDYDNDGDLDLFFTTVYGIASGGIPNYPVLYRNDGNWNFVDVTAEEGLAGLPPTWQGAWADYDNDGDLDLLAGGRLWQNQGGSNHWLQVRLDGTGEPFNRAAIGAQVRINLPGTVIARQVEGGTGRGNQNQLRLHFGLGAEAGPVDLEIFWPDGSVQIEESVAVDQILTVGVPELKIQSFQADPNDGSIVFTWKSLSNRVYDIERTTDLGVQSFAPHISGIPGAAPLNIETGNLSGVNRASFRIVK